MASSSRSWPALKRPRAKLAKPRLSCLSRGRAKTVDMSPEQLDGIVRVSGVTLLLLLAVVLIRDGKSRRIAIWFAPLALCLSGFLIGNTPDVALRLHGMAGATAHLLSGYAAVFLWWFCLAGFDQDFRPRGATLAFGLAWFVLASADRGLLGDAIADKGLSWVLVAMGFAMVAHLAWRLIRDRAGDLLEGRRKARVTVVVSLGGLLLVELTKEVLFGLDWRPRAFTILENAEILAFTLWLFTLVLRVNTAPLTAARRGVEPFAADLAGGAGGIDPEAGLALRLTGLIDIERIHLDPALSFDAFVQRIGAPEREVRRLINHRLGHNHFRAFLNVHRVDEARRLLATPSRAGDKLIAIALDSGFASLASFNRAFRAVERATPSEYRARLGGVTGGKRPNSFANPAFEERSNVF
ncbi:MAG: transcriptional regulator, AraC family [Alphaproteobacteria bacterium]|nr:transcriptional regulator, AraC family [Alphaproteobacteria bacterium]